MNLIVRYYFIHDPEPVIPRDERNYLYCKIPDTTQWYSLDEWLNDPWPIRDDADIYLANEEETPVAMFRKKKHPGFRPCEWVREPATQKRILFYKRLFTPQQSLAI